MNQLNSTNLHVLIVEDTQRYLAALLDELTQQYGYTHLDTAVTPTEAKTKLQDHYYHLIIADMRFTGETENGFDILQFVQELHLSSLVIILTANDTVADCRRAFKNDAFDYISKNGRDVITDLHQAMQAVITYFNQRGNEKDQTWITQQQADLLTHYAGQYIAVVNGQVIAAAVSETDLQQQIRAQQYPLFLPVITRLGSVVDLIKLESDTLEFKSTFLWNIKAQKQDDTMRFSVLKTIAAFLNSKGGTLLIGVKDDGTILGLEHDLVLLRNRTLDEFQQQLINSISDRSRANVIQLLTIYFETVNGLQVCVVNVRPSVEPVFLKVKERDEKERLEFFIRSGNTTRALNVQEFYQHIKQVS